VKFLVGVAVGVCIGRSKTLRRLDIPIPSKARKAIVEVMNVAAGRLNEYSYKLSKESDK
jgi:hypothetical protein